MINKVILVGNVGADPEIRTLETGTKVARLRLATTERILNRQTQETREHTEWHTVILWAGLADVADKYVRKGSRLYVEGSLRSNEWTDKEGVKRVSMEVNAREMKLLDRRPEGGGGYSSPAPFPSALSTPEGYVAPASASSGYSAPSSSTAAPATPVDDPDDLPF